MSDLWENLVHSLDVFIGYAKVKINLVSITGLLEFLVAYAVPIIMLTFVCLILYNIFIRNDNSIRNLKELRALVICALFIAINSVLGYFSIMVGNYLRVGFGFLTLSAAGMLFGPTVGCVVGIIQDIVNYILKPSGPYLPMLTIISGTSGIIYGMFFYKRKITFLRVFLAKLTVSIFIDIFLTSISLTPIINIGIAAFLPARIIKNIMLVPFESIVLYMVLKSFKRVEKLIK